MTHPDVCEHGDKYCPCPDGLICHYEGPDPWPCPTSGVVACEEHVCSG